MDSLSNVFFPAIGLLRNYDRETRNQIAEESCDIYVNYVNSYLENPKNHPAKLGWISTILDIYSMVDSFDVASAFFQNIDIKKTAGLYTDATLAYLYRFIEPMIRYIKRIPLAEERFHIISDVFRDTIGIAGCASRVNSELNSYLQALQEAPCSDLINVVILALDDYEDLLDKFPEAEPILASIEESNQRGTYIYIDLDLISMSHRKSLKGCFPLLENLSRKTLGTVISRVGDLFYKAACLVEDQNLCNALKEEVKRFYDAIELDVLGKILEIRSKNISSVTNQLIRIRGGDNCVTKFLQGLNFKRLALSYNEKPIGNTQLAAFCRHFLSSKSLISQWRDFFELVDFSIPFRLARFSLDEYRTFASEYPDSFSIFGSVAKINDNFVIIDINDIPVKNRSVMSHAALLEIYLHSGFNTTDLTMIFQISLQIFPHIDARRKFFSEFSLSSIGMRSRRKKPKSIEQLLRRLNQLRLEVGSYREFVAGLGRDECKRLADEGSINLKSLILRCEYSPNELAEMDMTYISKIDEIIYYVQRGKIKNAIEIIRKETVQFDQCDELLKFIHRLACKSYTLAHAKALIACIDGSAIERPYSRLLFVKSLMATAQYNDALGVVRSLIESERTNAEYHNIAGNILKELNLLELSEAEYRTAIELATSNNQKAKYTHNIALLITQMKNTDRYSEGITLCDEAIKLYPEFKWPYITKESIIKSAKSNAT